MKAELTDAEAKIMAENQLMVLEPTSSNTAT